MKKLLRNIAQLFKKKPVFDDATARVIDSYQNYEVIGTWGFVDVKTGESEIRGNMLSETIKVKDQQGNIALRSRWVCDADHKPAD